MFICVFVGFHLIVFCVCFECWVRACVFTSAVAYPSVAQLTSASPETKIVREYKTEACWPMVEATYGESPAASASANVNAIGDANARAKR